MSLSTCQTDSQADVSNVDIVYRRLSFEDDLFTARVYKRNYGNPFLLQDWKAKHQNIPAALTLSDTVEMSQRGLTTDSQGRSLIVGGSTMNAEMREMFLEACKLGDILTVQSLLETGHDVCSTEAHPESLRIGAIHLAVQFGHKDVVKTLFLHGASLEDRTTSIGYRPLHIAVKSRNLPMVKLLLRCGAHVSAENHYGEQPIHLAARYGSAKLLTTLLKAGAELESPDVKGRQPLYCASASVNRPQIIEFLASKGCDINARRIGAAGDRPFDVACRRGHLDNVWALVRLGAKPSSGYRYNISPTFKSLLKRRADTITGSPSSHIKLHWLVFVNSLEIGNIKAITKLLKSQGADVNAMDDNGDAALHLIARQRNASLFLDHLAEVLLNSGADPCIVNKAGLTPLAICGGHIGDPILARLLTKFGGV